MKKIESSETLKRLICIVTISMAVTGILFIPQIMFSRVKLSKTQENESIDIAKSELVSTESNNPLPKTSSRNSEEIRSSDDNAETITEKQEESKNDTSNKDENETKTAESKKENKKTELKKEVKKEKQETKTKKIN